MPLPFAKRTFIEFNAFSSTSEKKIQNFTLFWTTAAIQNGDFKLSSILEKKTKALWDILTMFWKWLTKGFFLSGVGGGRNLNFSNCRRIFDIYRNWVLIPAAGSFGDIAFSNSFYKRKRITVLNREGMTRDAIHIAFPYQRRARRTCHSFCLKTLHVEVSFHREYRATHM